jgi:hypothetical protein
MKTPEGEEKDLDWVDIHVEMVDNEKAGGDYINMASLDEAPVVVNSPTPEDVYVIPDDIKEDGNDGNDDDDDGPVLT